MPVDPQEANRGGVPRRRPDDVIAAADHNLELQRQLAESIVELERGDATVPFREILAKDPGTSRTQVCVRRGSERPPARHLTA